jgi:hypothetical protein
MGSDEEFVEFLLGHIKEEYPEIETERDDDTLRVMIRGGIERAKSHELSTAEDLAAFVTVMFGVAPNFDEQAELKAVLNDKNTPADERFDKLWAPTVSEEAWEEAQNNYDENAWFPNNSVNQEDVD